MSLKNSKLSFLERETEPPIIYLPPSVQSKYKFGANEIIQGLYLGGETDTDVYNPDFLKSRNFIRILNVACECKILKSSQRTNVQDVTVDSDSSSDGYHSEDEEVKVKPPIKLPIDITIKKVSIIDSAGVNSIKKMENNIEDCIEFIDEGLKHGNVLIHCIAGISRSATVVVAYLMKKIFLQEEIKKLKIDPNHNFKKDFLFCKALNFVREKRPFIRPEKNFGLFFSGFSERLYDIFEREKKLIL